MLYSLKELRIKKEKAENELRVKKAQAARLAVKTTHIVGDSKEDVSVEAGSFEDVYENVVKLENTILSLGLIIASENAKETIDFEDKKHSINSLLILSGHYTKFKSLRETLKNNVASKRRLDVGNSGTFYYEEKSLEYQVSDMEKAYKELDDKLTKIASLIDEKNSTTKIEFDI